jgi:glutathione S-transferase
MTAIHCGVADKIKNERANTQDPQDPITTQNPLGKIPALILDDGTTLFDSRVICEYLDSLHSGPKIFPQDGRRWQALSLAALADGIMDAAILQIYERRYRAENMVVQEWVDRQVGKVERALAWLEKSLPPKVDSLHIGHIGVASALGYLDFRFAGKWRGTYPALVDWLKNFEADIPAYAATMPTD